MLADEAAKKNLQKNEYVASKDGGLHVIHQTKDVEYFEENKLDDSDDGYRNNHGIINIYIEFIDDENGNNFGIKMSYEERQKQIRKQSIF